MFDCVNDCGVSAIVSVSWNVSVITCDCGWDFELRLESGCECDDGCDCDFVVGCECG